jgi:hypothetical protein
MSTLESSLFEYDEGSASKQASNLNHRRQHHSFINGIPLEIRQKTNGVSVAHVISDKELQDTNELIDGMYSNDPDNTKTNRAHRRNSSVRTRKTLNSSDLSNVKQRHTDVLQLNSEFNSVIDSKVGRVTVNSASISNRSSVHVSRVRLDTRSVPLHHNKIETLNESKPSSGTSRQSSLVRVKHISRSGKVSNKT